MNDVPGWTQFADTLRAGFKGMERLMDSKRFTEPTRVFYDIKYVCGQAIAVPVKVTKQDPLRDRPHGKPFVD